MLRPFDCRLQPNAAAPARVPPRRAASRTPQGMPPHASPGSPNPRRRCERVPSHRLRPSSLRLVANGGLAFALPAGGGAAATRRCCGCRAAPSPISLWSTASGGKPSRGYPTSPPSAALFVASSILTAAPPLGLLRLPPPTSPFPPSCAGTHPTSLLRAGPARHPSPGCAWGRRERRGWCWRLCADLAGCCIGCFGGALRLHRCTISLRLCREASLDCRWRGRARGMAPRLCSPRRKCNADTYVPRQNRLRCVLYIDVCVWCSPSCAHYERSYTPRSGSR